MESHSAYEKGVGGKYGQSYDARSEKTLWWRHDRIKEISRECEVHVLEIERLKSLGMVVSSG